MTVCAGEPGTGKTVKGQQSGIAGEVCMGLSQEARGSQEASKSRASCRLPRQRPGLTRWPCATIAAVRGGPERGSTEALGRILLCVHGHCVPATCKELPEPGTMRHSNFDSKELHFEYNKNSQLRGMSTRQQPCLTGQHRLSNLILVTQSTN